MPIPAVTVAQLATTAWVCVDLVASAGGGYAETAATIRTVTSYDHDLCCTAGYASMS